MENSKRRSFGEVVTVDGATVSVIAKMNVGDNELHMNSRPCMSCDDEYCVEFDNLLTVDGKWLYHVSECRMTDG